MNQEASSIMSKSAEYALEEERLAARCVKELGLIQGSQFREDFSTFAFFKKNRRGFSCGMFSKFGSQREVQIGSQQ